MMASLSDYGLASPHVNSRMRIRDDQEQQHSECADKVVPRDSGLTMMVLSLQVKNTEKSGMELSFAFHAMVLALSATPAF